MPSEQETTTDVNYKQEIKHSQEIGNNNIVENSNLEKQQKQSNESNVDSGEENNRGFEITKSEDSSELSDIGEDQSEAETDKMDFLRPENSSNENISDLNTLSKLTELARLQEIDSDFEEKDEIDKNEHINGVVNENNEIKDVKDVKDSKDSKDKINGKRGNNGKREETRKSKKIKLDLKGDESEIEGDDEDEGENDVEHNVGNDVENGNKVETDGKLANDDDIDAIPLTIKQNKQLEDQKITKSINVENHQQNNETEQAGENETKLGNDDENENNKIENNKSENIKDEVNEHGNEHGNEQHNHDEEEEHEEEHEDDDDDEDEEREDNDNDEDGENDEEREDFNKQRILAVEELISIEKNFVEIRDKIYQDKLKILEHELQLCLDGSHPELTKIYYKINGFYQDSLRLANNTLNYRLKCINTETIATRTSIHQDFLRHLIDGKNEMILETTSQWYKINKERNEMDQIVPDFSYKAIPEIRSQEASSSSQMNGIISNENGQQLNGQLNSQMNGGQLNGHTNNMSGTNMNGNNFINGVDEPPQLPKKVIKQNQIIELVSNRNDLNQQLSILNNLIQFNGFPSSVNLSDTNDLNHELLLSKANDDEIAEDLNAMGIPI